MSTKAIITMTLASFVVLSFFRGMAETRFFSTRYISSSINDLASLHMDVEDHSLNSTDWPMFHCDPYRTGYSTSSSPTTNNTLWTYAVGGRVGSSPVVAKGRLFVGSLDNNYTYCLNATTGELIWQYLTQGDVFASPAFGYGMIFVGSWDQRVYALNATSGALIWNFTTGGRIHVSSPNIVDGTVFIGCWDDRKVYALDALTGALRWNYTTNGFVGSSPAVSKERVFVGSINYTSDSHIYALNATTGALIWSLAVKGPMASSPALHKDVVFTAGYWTNGAAQGYVYALNASTGAVLWNHTDGPICWSSPTIAYGKVFIGNANNHNDIFALNATTGELIWRFETEGQVRSSPAVADGKVFVGSHDGILYALDEEKGRPIWSYETDGPVFSSPAIADGKVFIGSDDGKIYAFGVPTGPVAPSATFSVKPNTPFVGESVVFNASNSYDLDGSIVSYTWNFGDGHSIAETSPIVIHTYLSAKTFAVTLVVVDDDGLTDNKTRFIAVVPTSTSSESHTVTYPIATYLDPFEIELEFKVEVEMAPPSKIVSRQSGYVNIDIQKELAVVVSEYEPFLPQEKAFFTPMGDSPRIQIATLAGTLVYYLKLSNASVLMDIKAQGNGTVLPSVLQWDSAGTQSVKVSHNGSASSVEGITLRISSKYTAKLTLLKVTGQGVIIEEKTQSIELEGAPSLSMRIPIIPTVLPIETVIISFMIGCAVVLGIIIGVFAYYRMRRRNERALVG